MLHTNIPVNLRFYLKLIAKEFISTVISSWHKHIQHIKSLEKSNQRLSRACIVHLVIKREKREILIIQNSHFAYIYIFVSNRYYWSYTILNVAIYVVIVLPNSLIKNYILHRPLFIFLNYNTYLLNSAGYLYIFGLNRECTQRRRVFCFNNLKDKSPQIGLMHDWYDYTPIECSFFHI